MPTRPKPPRLFSTLPLYASREPSLLVPLFLTEADTRVKQQPSIFGDRSGMTAFRSGSRYGVRRVGVTRLDPNVWIGCVSQVRMLWMTEVADMYQACFIGSWAVAVMGHTHAPWSH